MNTTNFPALYNPADVYVTNRTPRIAEFAQAGFQASVKPAAQDVVKSILLIVDMQIDFCDPNGNLSVPGAMNDVGRLIEFIYGNIESLTSITASLDSHNIFQIFFGSWWAYEDGTHPAPYTMISLNAAGEIVDQDGRPIRPLLYVNWTRNTYLPSLAANGSKTLMIWPYHTLIGQPGHALVPALSECLAYYAAARKRQVQYLQKGEPMTTEYYGIFGPEVQNPDDPATAFNVATLDVVGRHDRIYIAGEAKSHCVFETKRQAVNYYSQRQPEVIKKLNFLQDCTSSVVSPYVDFDALANAEEKKFARQGVQLVNSTDVLA